MRYERVIIEGFGALSGETLNFVPGMTVIFGPNESGKSTLHAATYAALCGVRRSRGQPRIEDRLFAARHRPWSGQPWRVQAHVLLADGRQIELWHDLDGRVDCRAVDTGLGRDVSNEIMFEGTPDGSRWLGFDRGSFVATACVRQSAIAAVLENADALQDELQRAAASAGRDETAATAIERLKSFSTEKVGLVRANSTRPLQSAITEGERSHAALEQARQRHEDYLRALVGVAEREAARDAKRQALWLAEAVVARATADRARRVSERASELAAKYPQEPHGSSGYGQLGDAVAEALALWDGCPAEPDLSGETVDALEAQLAQMPERPEGDLSPAQEVLDAGAALRAATEVLERHVLAKPAVSREPSLPAGADELERLAVVLDADVPPADGELGARVSELRAHIGTRNHSLPRLPLGIAALLAVGGIAGAVAVSPAVGIALLAVAVVVAGMTFWLGRPRSDQAAADALETAERMLSEQQTAAEEIRSRQAAATERLRVLGLPTEPNALRVLVTARQAALDATGAFEIWEAEHVRLATARESAIEAVRSALRTRQAEVGADVEASEANYKVACAARDRQEREANRRPGLEQRLAARRAAETEAAARTGARGQLLRVAAQAGVEGDTPPDVARGLRAWQVQRQQDYVEHDVATAEWSELEQILGGRSLDELKAETAAVQIHANSLVARFTADELASLDTDAASRSMEHLRAELERVDGEASYARGDVERMAMDMPGVPEAEERCAAAETELERVRALQDVLERTIGFLEAAQERVHRTIAPVLQETLRRWMPRVVVTRDGDRLVERYDDVMVDPESLQVQVRHEGASWHEAEFLSEGTKEQIFLLLRVALAEHLTKPGECAPLILDEVTAQCDSDRRIALLNLVHEMSAERQVILFTHDEGALAWAREHLDVDSGRDRLEVREALTAA